MKAAVYYPGEGIRVEERAIPHPEAGQLLIGVKAVGICGSDLYIKLEFPIDESSDEHEWRDACLEVTAASPRPWTLLSAGRSIETFGRQLEVACEAGASGYVAGRAVWNGLVAGGFTEADDATREARRRLQHLTDIAVTHATPWTAWFDGFSEASRGNRQMKEERNE